MHQFAKVINLYLFREKHRGSQTGKRLCRIREREREEKKAPELCLWSWPITTEGPEAVVSQAGVEERRYSQRP